MATWVYRLLTHDIGDGSDVRIGELSQAFMRSGDEGWEYVESFPSTRTVRVFVFKQLIDASDVTDLS